MGFVRFRSDTLASVRLPNIVANYAGPEAGAPKKGVRPPLPAFLWGGAMRNLE
jgi:hypothetical protein